MLLITTALLIIFSGYQIITTIIFKKNVKNQIFKLLMGTLIFDFIISLSYILTIKLNANSDTIKAINILYTISFSSYLLFKSSLLKDKNLKRENIFIAILVTIILFTTLFSNVLTKPILIVLLSLVVISFIISFKVKLRYSSKYITLFIHMLYFTEIIRISILALINYQLATTGVSIFLIVGLYIFKSFSILFISDIHDTKSISANLASTIDYITPAKLLSITYNENPDAVVLTNDQREIVYANPQSLKMTGYLEEEVIGKTPKIFSSGKTSKEVYKDMNKSLLVNNTWTGEFINKKKNGELFIEEAKLITIKGLDQEALFYLAIKNDISKEKEYLSKIEYLSSYDSLTGLLRRHKYLELVEESVNNNKDVNHYFALIDFDKFKTINDTYGHMVGDDTLVFFSKILKEIFGDKTLLCRFGGDEFSIYIYDKTPLEVTELFDKLIERLNNTKTPNKEADVFLAISVGVYKFTGDYNYQDVYQGSDKLLYLSKQTKKSSIETNFNI